MAIPCNCFNECVFRCNERCNKCHCVPNNPRGGFCTLQNCACHDAKPKPRSRAKRKVFKKGSVAIVNIKGFHYAGKITEYDSRRLEAWIEFPANDGFTEILCVKAKNSHHWNPVEKSVF